MSFVSSIIVAVVSFLLGFAIVSFLSRKPKGPSHSGAVRLQDWGVLATGRSGWKEIERAWLRKAQEVFEVFCKKQADYGPNNIAVAGERGITLRLGDKLSRLFELLGLTSRENTGDAKNEPIRDTWVDFADYGIIGLIVHDGDWPLVEPNQVWGKGALASLVIDIIGDDPKAIRGLIKRLLEFDLAKTIADDIGGTVQRE